MRLGIFLFLIIGFTNCTNEEVSNTFFKKVSPKDSGIDFTNEVINSKAFNIFNYRNFYNGGGVGIGDINNDGLADVFLTANLGKNKLYLNKGNFKFEDISEASGTEGTKGWSTGVAMVDINADGFLDIYVCNAGYLKGDDQKNELFINNGNNTFTEKAAEFGLDESGYTTHAAFFDYDLDGDLDCYILNNSFMPVNTLNYSNKRELYAKDWPVKDFLKGGGDKLMRNDNGKFSDVSEEAGIFGSLIGFGLGVTAGDVNGDNLPDLYISNDFFERDYLYINNGDGTFSEEIKDWMEHLSLASMGTDMADINNDGYPEIFATEMLPESDFRRKTTTLFENYNIYYLKLKRDFYHQYMQNTLQLNNKDGSFSDIAYYSGVAATDWSWGALMFDADNDGFRDIYVCNGVYKDVTDQDFMDFFADEIIQKMAITGKKEDIDKVIDKMPSVPVYNKFFSNNGDLTFEDLSHEFEAEPSFSNGAAYGDLDNDGDLDLIVNNLNQPVFVFENQYNHQNRHYLKIKLEGSGKNTFAIGSKIALYRGEEVLSNQLIPSRGFQSSVDYTTHFGLGDNAKIDSLVIIWPDRTKYISTNIPVDTTLKITYKNGGKVASFNPISNPQITLFQEVSNDLPKHEEDSFVDFYSEGLTSRMISREGPKAAVGDVNGDGLEDVFIGGSTGKFDFLYLQTKDGFELKKQFESESYFETTAATFFDADGDGDLDLYAGSGGNDRSKGGNYFQDRVYLNTDKGNLEPSFNALPKNNFNTSVVLTFDLENDGDLDLFVGSRSVPNNYGAAAKSYIYENDGKGNFKDVTNTVSPKFHQLGMVTDAKFINVSGNEKPELVVVGEWMSPRIFELKDGKFEETQSNINDWHGWWYAIEANDVDGDGDQDLILGNRGENFYYSGSPENPAKLWLSDFDLNGTTEKIITQTIDDKDVPVPMKKELTEQIVSLKKANLKHGDYGKKSIQELFPEQLINRAKTLKATHFQSVIAINDGNGNFELKALPKEVQFSCVCDIQCLDLNGDQKDDLILGGNDAGFTPQFSKLDASFGHVLMNNGDGSFDPLENRETGFFVKGDVKQFSEITINGERHILTLINNKEPKIFKIK